VLPRKPICLGPVLKKKTFVGGPATLGLRESTGVIVADVLPAGCGLTALALTNVWFTKTCSKNGLAIGHARRGNAPYIPFPRSSFEVRD